MGRWTMDVNVNTLLREPEILARVFLLLDQRDLRTVEQVCHAWRGVVDQQSVWRRRLLRAINSRTGWAQTMGQLGLVVPVMSQDQAKDTFRLLCTRLLPTDMTAAGPQPIMRPRIIYVRVPLIGTDQWLYEKARREDLVTIFQNCPDTITLFNHEREFTMSTLLVFGASAFPLLSTEDGRIVMAGAHFGKGRVVVLPHESLLQDRQLLSGAAQWVASSPSPVVSADPVSRAGGNWVYINPWHRHLKQPFDDMNQVGRQNLLDFQEQVEEPQVYITEGHYDDHGENVVEYVRRGGGLIIGGHAWFWTSQHRHDQCMFKTHPGNKIITHFGIAFTRHAVEGQVSRVPIPTPTSTSLLHLHQLVKMRERSVAELQTDVLHNELKRSAYQLRTENQFEDILAAVKQFEDHLAAVQQQSRWRPYDQ